MKGLDMLIANRPLRKSRIALLAATVVVVLGMLAGLGAFLLSPARAAVGPLPAAALVLPADARFVMGFDVKRFTGSPFYTRYAARTGTKPPAFGELEQKTGLDAARDVDQIIVAGSGVGKDAEMVALAIGRFDVAKLTRALESEGKASAYRHEGSPVWAFKAESPRAGAADAPRATTVALAPLGRDMLLFGSQRRVEAALASRKRGQAPLRSNELLVRLAEKVRPGATFWMVGDGSLLAGMPASFPAPGAPAGSGATLNLPTLRSLMVTGDLDPLVSLAITGEAVDEPGARNLADVVRGLVALAALQAQQSPELQQLASAISVATEQNRVLVTARIPYELIDALSTAGRRTAPAPKSAAPAPRP
jgi:hypothetical protein